MNLEETCRYFPYLLQVIYRKKFWDVWLYSKSSIKWNSLEAHTNPEKRYMLLLVFSLRVNFNSISSEPIFTLIFQTGVSWEHSLTQKMSVELTLYKIPTLRAIRLLTKLHSRVKTNKSWLWRKIKKIEC